MNNETEAPRHAKRALPAPRAIAVAAAALTLGLLGIVPAAEAAGAPKVSPGGAKDVLYSSATLTGTINPEGSASSYYFQYGPTRAYGGQSAIAGTAAVSTPVGVALSVGGLQPLTVYHYRLVAVNAAGTTIGGDRTFQTTSVPLSLAIFASPDPAPFGSPVAIQGTLSGTLNAGRAVFLQGQPFPFTTPFVDIGNSELTNASGGFNFTLLGAAVTARFRVVTTTNPPVVSPVATEDVAVRVSSHITRARRPGYVRVFGTVTPAENGAEVGVLRIAHGRGVLVGGTVLRPDDASDSSFSRVVRVHPGIYRVLVRVVGAGQVSSYGQPLLIR
ncbi:MAG: hypothetical protein ACLQBB_03865 [Solirubrobacteraceae bacterium]